MAIVQRLMGSAAILWIVVAATNAQAQQASAPSWVPGTICKYENTQTYSSGRSVNVRIIYSQTVLSVQDDLVTLESGPGHVKRVVNRDGNSVSYDRTTYAPFYPTFAFPISVGKAWGGEVTETYATGQTIHAVTARVAGFEKVTVPAGTFDTFRIEIAAKYDMRLANGRGGQNTTSETLWYSPKVSRPVANQSLINDWVGRPRDKYENVLLSCNGR